MKVVEATDVLHIHLRLENKDNALQEAEYEESNSKVIQEVLWY